MSVVYLDEMEKELDGVDIIRTCALLARPMV